MPVNSSVLPGEPTEEQTAYFIAGIVASAFERGIPVSGASIIATDQGLSQLFMEKQVDLKALVCGKGALNKKFKNTRSSLWHSCDIAIVKVTYELPEKKMLARVKAATKEAQNVLEKRWAFVRAASKELCKNQMLLGDQFEQLWYKTVGELRIDKKNKIKKYDIEATKQAQIMDCPEPSKPSRKPAKRVEGLKSKESKT
jgi:hypothetical protein